MTKVRVPYVRSSLVRGHWLQAPAPAERLRKVREDWRARDRLEPLQVARSGRRVHVDGHVGEDERDEPAEEPVVDDGDEREHVAVRDFLGMVDLLVGCGEDLPGTGGLGDRLEKLWADRSGVLRG